MYIYICVHRHMNICERIHVRILVHTLVHIVVHMHVCIPLILPSHLYLYPYRPLAVPTHTYIYIHASTDAYIDLTDFANTHLPTYIRAYLHIPMERGKPGRPPHGCFTSPKTLVVSYDPCTSARMITEALI